MKTKYKIEIKRDFGKYGWYDSKTRKTSRLGFVVTDGFCNIIPGACWFKTIEDAMLGVRVHMITGNTSAFHDEYKRLKGLQQ